MNGHKRLLSFAVLLLLHSNLSFSQGNLFPNGKSPYPIIFVHGLDGSDESFQETMLYLNGGAGTGDYVGQWGSINVFDVVLNADNNDNTAILDQDVKWDDFTFDGNNINVGRRNFDGTSDLWVTSSIFAVNFAEERIRGAHGILNDLFDHSNEAAIFKQGYVLGQIIREVREFTGADKVILVGHSMGGLAIREYLQRTDSNGDHRWWLYPAEADGHKVARVVTIGTPHYGWDRLHLLANLSQKIVTDNRTQSVFPPNLSSEAIRDMSIEVEKSFVSGQNYNGPYLFGGLEDNAGQNTISGINFYNQDIDCDGDESDEIVGINIADINPANLKRDNPQMPLPSNIQYTWIVATGPDDDDDDVVSASRQYLDEPGDSIAVIVAGPIQHTNEGSAYQAIIRGMDEPDNPQLAYSIVLNEINGGFFTRQIGNIHAPTDTDCYRIFLPNASYLQVDFDAPFSDVAFVLKDVNLVQVGNTQNSGGNIEFNVPQGGVYYLYLTKDVSNILGNHLYYDFRVREIAAPLAEFSAFPTSGAVPLNVQFTDLSTSSQPITSRLWSFGDGVTSTATSPTHTFTAVGNYTVSLTVSDGVYSDTETKTNYITVNPSGPLPVIEVSGTITTNTVWVAGYVYKIVGSVTVANGVTLTIQPGVVVKFSNENRLTIDGALVAEGTPTQKIVFTSLKDDSYGGDTNNDGSATTPAAGNWDGMIFRNPSDDAVCKLDNCVIRYGGASFIGSLVANVKCEGASPTISNNEISYSASFGIFLDGASPQISGNVIANNSGGYGIYASNGSSPIIDNNTLVANGEGIHSETSTPTITNNTFTNAQGGFAVSLSNMPAGLNPMTGNTGSGNYFNGIGLSGGLGTSSTLRAGNVNLPYVFSGLTINAGTTLTIEPGVVVKFSNENRLTIDGALVAEGTPTQKIVFTSLKDDSYGGDTNNDGSATTPAAGNWDGMIFRNPSDDAVCKLDNCVIRYGGASFIGSLVANVKCEGASPTISNNEISYSASFGIFLDGASPQISGNVIANNSGGYGIYASNGSSPIIDNNTLVANGEGIHSETSTPTITNNTFTNAQGGFAVSLSNMPAGLNPMTGNTGSGNYFNGIGLSGGLGTSSTLRAGNVNLPYVFSGLTINAGTTLTIEPGVVVKFSNENRLTIDGALVAEGTPTQKIVFTSLKDDSYGGDTNNDGSATTPAAGNWDGMIFRNPSDDAVCKLDNCVIRYGGASFIGSLVANVKCEGASPTISNNEISYSASFGIFLDGASPQISGNVIANNSGGYGIYASNGSSPIIDNNTLVANGEGIHSETSTPTITNNTFTNAQGGFAVSLSNMPAGLNPMTGNTGSGNYFNGIGLSGGLGTSSTLRAGNVNLPYVFSGLTINAGTTLTIEPGVVVKFSNENRLTIDGALVAEGTPTQKIVFTSLKDDSYGGDTNNDGSATTPAAGNWDGMIFRNPSDDAVCKLDNCVIRYGGASFIGSLVANVKCEGASPTISNNEISYSASFGIFLDGASPQISGNVIANNSGGYGIYASNGSSPIVNGNSIFGNSSYGLLNGTIASYINAHQNWWGNATGPLDNSDDRASGGFYNPNGLGNQVSDYVDYDPWLTAPGTGTTVPDIAVNPTSHNYGSVGIGSSVSQTFVVSNQGTTDLQVTATTLAGADANQFSIVSGGAPFTLAATQSQNLMVSFNPTSAGSKSASLQIASNDPNENPFSVNLTGTGLSVPQMSINDVSITEGNSGTVNAVFTVTLSAASSQQITVDYATANGTATAGSDYVAIPTTQLIIPANTPSQTITVVVNGDLLDEVDETFFVNLSNATNAVITDDQGKGTITDDDPLPSLSINDFTVTEGNTGTVNATFTVTLSAASGKQVTVDYATADGTATAGSGDYVSIPTTQLIFPAGVTTQNITVTVNGDVLNEANETFFVNLSNEGNATIADAQGLGTISNDDVTLVTIVLNPTDDAYVRSDQTSSNFGTATTVRMKQSSPIYNSYLKFVVSGVNGPVQSAKLRMKVTVASSSGGSVYTVSNNQKGSSTPWTQSNLKYSNAPSISGTPLSTVGSVTVNQIVEFEVTSAVTGNNTYSFGLNNASTTTVQYSSKEGATKPELVIQFVPQPPAITSFSPPSGPVGTQVTITGNNFTGATQVLFNSVAASVFTVNSNTQITATVPTAATTGKITVTTPGGTATSSTDFIVTLPPIVLNPTDDAYVRSDQATTNFGTATTLRMKQSSSIYNSYLKFVVSGVTGTVSSAKLRLKVTVASSSGGSVYSVLNNYLGTSTSWLQSGLKYNNAPTISGTPLSTVGSVTVNQVVEFDVKAAITGNGTFSFGLKNSSSTTVQYSSKEGATKPELVIQTGSSSMAKTVDLDSKPADAKSAEFATPLPERFALSPNYPNPFNAQTAIEYALPEAVNVRLLIYNVLGQFVRTLVDENQTAGYKRVIWDARNEFGVEVSAGVYFLQLKIGRQKFMRKMFLLR